jgi:TP901 family phage tail tape measure protein
MALNLESIFRITTKIRDDGLANLAKGLERVDAAGNAAKKSFSGAINSGAWQGAAVAAGGVLLALSSSVKTAIEFETAIAGVRKVMEGMETPQGLKEVRQEIIDLSREMPIAATGFAEIYAAAGASGIAREEVRQFAVDVAKMGIAFDMTAGEAGTAMGKLRTSLGLTQPEVVLLADAMNYLDANGNSAAKELVEFTLRTGAVGQMAGLSAEQTTAFGAAMIGMGVQTEIAATSFNNMIKALSKGASATDRQQSALIRLGFAGKVVQTSEKQMTAEVQRQSDRRLEIMQDASDRQMKELRRRYRNEMQLLEDQWEDKSDAEEEAITDAADAQIEALQRQADAQIKAIQTQQQNAADGGDALVQIVRDRLDDETEAIRDAADQKLKLLRRAARDEQQDVRDAMDDKMDIEAKAIERANAARVEAEKAATKKTIEEIKKTANAGAVSVSEEMAKRLQADALGTIKEVMKRLQNIPAEERISVLMDLFGEEARGLSQLVNNLPALEKALSLVADKYRYAGSMTKEYNVQSQTTANALQLSKNNFDALAITVGAQLVPALTKLVSLLEPVITGFLRFAEAQPVLTTIGVSIAAIVSALVLAAPFILSVVTLLGQLGVGAGVLGGIAATIAGWAGAVVPFLTAIGSAIAAVGAFVASIVSAPVVIALAIGVAVGAIIAGIYMFREQIGGFLSWMVAGIAQAWGAITSAAYVLFVKPWVDLWLAIRPAVTGAWEWIKSACLTAWSAIIAVGYQLFIAPWVALWMAAQQPVTDLWEWVKSTAAEAWRQLTALAYSLYVEPWVDLWTQVLRDPITNTIKWLQATWSEIASLFTQYVTKPIQQGWAAMVDGVQKTWRQVVDFIPKSIQMVSDKVKSIFNGIVSSITNGINAVIRSINDLIRKFNNVAAATKNPLRISYLSEVPVPKFAQGGFVSGPTLAMLGDNLSGKEYAVPAEKALAFANNIMAGRRGADAIPGAGASPAPSGLPPVTLYLQTGPMQPLPDGRAGVAVEDVERLIREALGQYSRVARTPGGRYVTGTR